jgi:hypothetical protein
MVKFDSVSVVMAGRSYTIQSKSVRPRIWRVLHDKELGELRRSNLPEVFPMFPNHHVWFRRHAQLRSRELNPILTPDQWTKIYTNERFITNQQGFEKPGDPRNNYVTGDTGHPEDPKTEVLTCGGNLLTGYVDGGHLHVMTLDYRAELPPAGWLMKNPWFLVKYVGVGSTGIPRRFPPAEQSNGYIPDVLHPLIADPNRFIDITIPLRVVEEWTSATLPDTYTIYRN